MVHGSLIRGLAAAMILAVLPLAPPCAAEETAWIRALAASLEKQRSVSEILDSSRSGTSSRAPVISVNTLASGVLDDTTSAWSLAPRAGISVTSPGAASSGNVSWQFAAGGALDVSKGSIYDPVAVFLGPYISAQTTIRLASRTKDGLSPGEALQSLELAGKLRGVEEKSLSGFLEACSMAALSASSHADALRAKAKADYLEKNLRRMDILMQGGKISRADYLAEKDSFDAAETAASDIAHEAVRLGRDSRARARPASFFDNGETVETPKTQDYFLAVDLEAIAKKLEPLLESADPVPAAVESATVEWDLRLAELSAEAVAKAPQLTASLDTKLGWNDNEKRVAPIVSGSIGFNLTLGPEKAVLSKNIEVLKKLRSSVAVDAEDLANRQHAEQRILLQNRKDLIFSLTGKYKESLRLADVYTKLLAQGAVTEIERLSALSTLAEAESSLARARAGYFLDIVTALAGMKIPFRNIVEALSQEEEGSSP